MYLNVILLMNIINFSADWDYVGKYLCNMNHNMLPPREADGAGVLNDLGEMLKSVLDITKVCMSKSEEELQGKFMERLACTQIFVLKLFILLSYVEVRDLTG